MVWNSNGRVASFLVCFMQMGDHGVHNVLNTVLQRDKTPVFLFGDMQHVKTKVDNIKVAMESFEGVMNYKTVDIWMPKTDAGRFPGFRYGKMAMCLVATAPLEYLVCVCMWWFFITFLTCAPVLKHLKLFTHVRDIDCVFFCSQLPG